MACDIECQRQRKLKTLLDAYMDASAKSGIDPQRYEQTKIAYFSFRDGPEWTKNYADQKQSEAQEQQRRKQKVIDDHQPVEPAITEDSYEFTNHLKEESDLKWREYELGGSSSSYYWIELGLTIVLSLFIAYQVYKNFPRLLSYFT